MADQLSELVKELREAHGENLSSVVLYGSTATGGGENKGQSKNILVVLNRITPRELKAAHEAAEVWRSLGNPLPIYFSTAEIVDSSDVFPIEFIDMSRAHKVLYGTDPFDGLAIDTHNLRHQLEYELRGKLIRLRTVYIPVSENPNRLARLMADSLDSFAILFRHVLRMLESDAPFDKHECVMKLADVIGLDKRVFDRIFDYERDEEIWLEAETNQTFASYLVQIERVIEAVNSGQWSVVSGQ